MRAISFRLLKPALAFALGLSACSSPVTDPQDEQQSISGMPAPVCLVIQRGVLGAVFDTQIATDPSGASQNRNFGGSTFITTSHGDTGTSELLIKIDPGPLPPMLQLLSATLNLHTAQAGSDSIEVWRVPGPWDESTATWNSVYGSPAVELQPLSGVTSITADTTLVALNVADIAYEVGSGKSPNYGVLLRQSTAVPTTFFGSEALDIEQRPQFTYCYTPDLCAGVTCAAPDQCHTASACSPASGLCTGPAKADSTPCDDKSALTSGDVCTRGVCLGKAAQGLPYLLFAGGPGFACPTAETVWVTAEARDPENPDHAQLACEACYGPGKCYLSDEDGAGLAWGPVSPTSPACGQAYFGYTSGSTGAGDAGRAFAMCNSEQTFGYWGKQP